MMAMALWIYAKARIELGVTEWCVVEQNEFTKTASPTSIFEYFIKMIYKAFCLLLCCSSRFLTKNNGFLH